MGKDTQTTEISTLNIESFKVEHLPELKGKKDELSKELKKFKFVAITDTASYEEAKKSRTGIRTIRTGIEREQKNVVKKIKENILGTVTRAYEEILSKDILPLEKKQQEEVTRWEDLKEKERLEKIEKENNRKEQLVNSMNEYISNNKAAISMLTFEKIDSFKLDIPEDTTVFEEYETQFLSNVEMLKINLNEKIEALNDAEKLRITKEELAEEQRRAAIKNSIDNFYSTWAFTFHKLKFEDIDIIQKSWLTVKPLDCKEFQSDYAEKRASLQELLDEKIEFLQQKENNRIEAENLQKERDELEAKKEVATEEPELITPTEEIVEDTPIEEIEVVSAEVITEEPEEVLFEESKEEPKRNYTVKEIVEGYIISNTKPWKSIFDEYKEVQAENPSFSKWLETNYYPPIKKI